MIFEKLILTKQAILTIFVFVRYTRLFVFVNLRIFLMLPKIYLHISYFCKKYCKMYWANFFLENTAFQNCGKTKCLKIIVYIKRDKLHFNLKNLKKWISKLFKYIYKFGKLPFTRFKSPKHVKLVENYFLSLWSLKRDCSKF